MTSTFRTLVALFVLFALTACGGDATPETCRRTTVTVGLYGDSTNYGNTRNAPGAPPYRVENYPERVIQAAMDQRFGVGAVVVSTHALIGTRLSQLLAGHQGAGAGDYGDPWPAGATADIVLENFGINDALAGVSPEEFKAELRTMLAARPVVLETPLPRLGDDGLAQAVRDVAAETGAPLIDMNAFAHSMPTWPQFVHDGTHPDSDGYAALEQGAVVPQLVRLVAPLRCESTP